MKKLFDLLKANEKLAMFVLCVFTAIFSVVPLSALMAFITKGHFLDYASVVFWVFGAAPIVSALLCLLNVVPLDVVLQFGCGLYYGSLAACNVIIWLFPNVGTEAALTLGIVITILCCYIAYKKIQIK